MKEIKLLSKKIATASQDFNSCNAWGFGGGIGTQYDFPDGSTIRIGRAYYRHLPSHPFANLYFSDGNNTENKKEIINHLEKLNQE